MKGRFSVFAESAFGVPALPSPSTACARAQKATLSAPEGERDGASSARERHAIAARLFIREHLFG